MPTPGIGYTPAPGSVSHLYTGFNGGGDGGKHVMDLGADPFRPRQSNEEKQAAAEARYGPNFHGTDTTKPRFLALDFESLLGKGGLYLHYLWEQGLFWPAGEGRDGWPTLLELHDYFAVNPSEAANALAYSEPAPEPPPPPPPPPPSEEEPPVDEEPLPPRPEIPTLDLDGLLYPDLRTYDIEKALQLGRTVVMIGPGRKAAFNRAWRNYLRLEQDLGNLDEALDQVEGHIADLQQRLTDAYDVIYGR